MALSAADVVFVPFPFRDQTAASVRPAVVISASAYNQTGDLVLAAVTTHPVRSPFDYALTDWKSAGLLLPSTVRMLLATVSERRIVRRVGSLVEQDWQEVAKRVAEVIAWP